MRIIITNWSQYQKRTYKGAKWFSLSNQLIDDPDFFDFTFEEKWAWIGLLSVASLSGTNEIPYRPNWLSKRIGVQEKALKSSIEKLEQLQILEIVSNTSGINSAENMPELCPKSAATLHNITLHNINNTYADSAPKDTTPPQAGTPPAGKQRVKAFTQELDLIYKTKYPRKEGKARGMTKLIREIASPEDLAQFEKAVTNFATHHKKLGTEPQYLKHFSTFASEWRDWIDPTHGSVSSEFTTQKSHGIDWDEIKKRIEREERADNT